MSDQTSFRSVIDLWPSREAMAAEIGAGPWAVSKWWQRNSIPAEWWSPILATERAGQAGVTAQMMTDWAARPPVACVDAGLEART